MIKNPEIEPKKNEEKKKINRLRRITSLNLLAETTTKISNGIKTNTFNKIEEKDEEEDFDNINLSRNISSNLNNDQDNEYKDNILTSIEELISELESIGEVIKEQANDHINDNDVILTANHSDQLEDFFIEASQNKKFHVIIAESAPSLK